MRSLFLLVGWVAAQVLAAPAYATPDEAELLLERALSGVRAERADLDVRPSRWETRMTLAPIEAVLVDPISLAGKARVWGDRLRGARGAEVLGFAQDLLGASTAAVSASAAPADPGTGLRAAVELLVAELAEAKRSLDKAVASVSAEERARALAALRPVLTHGGEPAPEGPVYEAAERFDVAAALEAGRVAAAAVERALPALRAAKSETSRSSRTLSGLDVVVGGPGDDLYEEADLRGTGLLIDLGGNNRYRAPVAAAGAGELRVVIDLGRDVVIESTGSVASGVFGVGLLYLPEPGAKRLSAGDVSLGAGLFGVGAVIARGPVEARGGSFTQGAGAFGAGVFEAEGAGSRFLADYGGQGYGFTRGAGVFLQSGDGGRLECGLRFPDARDPSASISLCQGTGYGPRAFAAGGYGLARVDGSSNVVDSGYFAQGSGYWRALGALWIAGDGNRLQSRRYAQGGGIHAGVGALSIEGSRNRSSNWGVGPAFGWDYGVGLLDLSGDDNDVYAEWAAGRGDINGHGFTVVRGNRNRLSLPETAGGALKRNAAAYGLFVVAGRGNRLRLRELLREQAAPPGLRMNPWGSLVGGGALLLDPALSLEAPSWRSFEKEREEAARKERVELSRRLEEADASEEKVARWLSVASSGGLEGGIPRQAVLRLLALSPEEVGSVAAALAPERFDQLLWVRIVLAAFGENSGPAIRQELAASQGLRKALIAGLLRFLPVAETSGAAAALLADPDWRVRREGAAVLGYLLDRQRGEEPGRLVFLEEAKALCGRSTDGEVLTPEEQRRIGIKRLPDLYSALALDPSFGFPDRANLLLRTSNPFDAVGADSLQEFARIIAARPEGCAAVFERELRDAAAARPKARRALAAALADPDLEVRAAAAAALGQIGEGADAGLLAGLLDQPRANLREAAAAALGRLGTGAVDALRAAFASPLPRTRALAAVAAAQSYEPEVFRLVRAALDDPDEDVRHTAVAALAAAQSPLQPLRKEFLDDLLRLEERDPSAAVRSAASFGAAAAGRPR